MSKSQKEMLQELEAEYKLEPNTGMVNEHTDIEYELKQKWLEKKKAEDEETLALFDKAIDMVNKPPQYNQGGIETIDYMKAYSTREEYQGHLRLTAIKYLSRSGKKYDRAEDLKKGAWYLNKLIEDIVEERDNENQ